MKVVLYTDNKTLKSMKGASYNVSKNDADTFIKEYASKVNDGGNGSNNNTTEDESTTTAAN